MFFRLLLLAVGTFLASCHVAFWEPEPASGPADGATAHFLDDKLFVFGGRTSSKTWQDHVLRVFENGMWKAVPLDGEKNYARSSHTSVLYQGKLFIFGGRTGLFEVSNDLIVVDLRGIPSIRKVNARGIPPSARQAHATALIGSKMYIHGGSPDAQLNSVLGDLHVYDINTNSWEEVSQSGGLCSRVSHQLVPQGSLLHAFGGSAAGRTYNLKEISTFDTSTGRWNHGTGHIDPRLGHTASEVDGRVWLIGGRNENGMLGDVQVWDLDRKRLEDVQVRGSFSPRVGHCAAVGPEGKSIYVLGGAKSYSTYFDDMQQLHINPSSSGATRPYLEKFDVTRETIRETTREGARQLIDKLETTGRQYLDKLETTGRQYLSAPGQTETTGRQYLDKLEPSATRPYLDKLEPLADLKPIVVPSSPKDTVAFAERARRVLRLAESLYQTEAVNKADVSDLLRRTRDSLNRAIPQGLADDLRGKAKACRELEGALLGESDARKKLEEERLKLIQALQQLEGIAALTQGDKADLQSLQKEYEKWDGLVLDSDRAVSDAEKKLQGHELNVAQLRDELKKYMTDRNNLLDRLDAAREALRNAQSSLKTREAQYQSARLKYDSLEAKIAALEKQIAEKESRISELRRSLREAEAAEMELESKRLLLSEDLTALREKIAAIKKVLQDRSGVLQKWMEVEQAQRALTQIQADWLNKVRATGEMVVSKDPHQCTDCRLEIEDYVRMLEAKLRELEKELMDKSNALADLEQQMQAAVQRKLTLQNLLSGLEPELADLLRELKNLRQELEYEGRTIGPKLEAELKELRAAVERAEADLKELEDRLKKLLEFIQVLERKLRDEEREYATYAETYQRLIKERQGHALRRDAALDALENKVNSLEKNGQDLAAVRRRLADAEKEYELAYNLYLRHSRELQAILNDLSPGSDPAAMAKCQQLANECEAVRADRDQKDMQFRGSQAELTSLKIALDNQRRELNAKEQMVSELKAQAEAARKRY